VYRRVLNSLVIEGDRARRLSRANLDDGESSLGLAFSSDRVFVVTADTQAVPASNVPPPRSRALASFLVASTGQLQRLPTVDLGTGEYYWWPNLVARGKRAFLTEPNELKVIDTTTPSAPEVTTHEMPGYSCSSLQVAGDRAYCAMQEYGVATFEL
jgi:hypothetical protein